jgi:flagellar basal-body rod protein FlgB
MDLDQLTLFNMASRRLGYLSQRQTVLAENIANADTPGYRPNDLQPFADYLGDAGVDRMPPSRTHPMHLAGMEFNGGDADADTMGDVYEAAPSGNEVVLEQQMMAVQQTAADHRLAINLYRKHMGLLRMAVGRSGQ